MAEKGIHIHTHIYIFIKVVGTVVHVYGSFGLYKMRAQ